MILTHGDAILLIGSHWQITGQKGLFRACSVKARRKMVGSQLLIFSLESITANGAKNATVAKLPPYCDLVHQKAVYGPYPNWKHALPIP